MKTSFPRTVLLSFALLVGLVVAACTVEKQPATTQPSSGTATDTTTTGTDTTSTTPGTPDTTNTGGTTGDTGTTQTTPAPGRGEACGAGSVCASGLECVTYYGIAGPQGPAFTSCENKCSGGQACPAGTKCTTIADGPGQVCR